MEVNSFQLSTITTKSCILDVDRGPGLVKLIFVSQKKTPYPIQKLFKTETVSTVILKSYFARDLFGSQVPVTTGGLELRISCIQSSYLTH